ncbi:MAG: cytidine deaminase [Candidatus Competibacterales bacterium]
MLIPGHTIAAKTFAVDPALVERMMLAARKAHAPFSRFRVGTALIMADDPEERLHVGANVENSSYGATCCAERSALYHAAALGFRRLRYLAVSTADALERPTSERTPCGICRQVIRDFAGLNQIDEALIFVDTGADDVLCEVFDIERLLPYGFSFAGPGGE